MRAYLLWWRLIEAGKVLGRGFEIHVVGIHVGLVALRIAICFNQCRYVRIVYLILLHNSVLSYLRLGSSCRTSSSQSRIL